jgi:hypothetical protein
VCLREKGLQLDGTDIAFWHMRTDSSSRD